MAEPQFKWWEGGAGALLDQIICECGWESATFFDGQEYAHNQWKRHVKESHAAMTISPADRGGSK